MIVESKFNMGDTIYWMESNKVRRAVVKAIQFPMLQKTKTINLCGECTYFVSKNIRSSVVNWNGGGLKERQVFGSKKDLLKSL